MSFNIDELSGILSIKQYSSVLWAIADSPGPNMIIGGLSYAIFNAEASVKYVAVFTSGRKPRYGRTISRVFWIQTLEGSEHTDSTSSKVSNSTSLPSSFLMMKLFLHEQR